MIRFLVLAFLAALSFSCGPTVARCSSLNCSLGCCDEQGLCRPSGMSNCGTNGAACARCGANENCMFGACVVTRVDGVGGGVAGGSTAGGSTAGGSTAGGSTAGGSTAGGSTAGGSTAGGSTAGGSTAGGSTAGGPAGGVGGGSPECETGLTFCNSNCVDTKISLAHCGTCGRACGATESCLNGSCVGLPADCRQAACPSGFWCDAVSGTCRVGCAGSSDCPQPGSCDTATRTCSCAVGTHRCGGACVMDSSAQYCGAACRLCMMGANGSPACIANACSLSCAAGFHLCNGACVSDSATATCGGACTPCAVPANGSATCNGTSCGIACDTGFHACGTSCVSNADVATCGNRCTPCPTDANGISACSMAGTCTLTCNTGFNLCNGQCVPASSTTACGAACVPCATVTNGMPVCASGTCGFTCNSGYQRCGSTCRSNADPAACGPSCISCPSVTNGTRICSSGTCDFTCNSGFHRCGNTCRSNTDPTACGASCAVCAVPTNGQAVCSSGACGVSCNATYLACNNRCVMQTRAETCDGVDDDCDGTIDEGCGARTCTDPFVLDPTAGTTASTWRPGAGTASGACVGAGSNAVYTWRSPVTADVTVTASNTERIAVRDSCGATTNLACLSIQPGAGNRIVSFPAVAGTTYFIITGVTYVSTLSFNNNITISF